MASNTVLLPVLSLLLFSLFAFSEAREVIVDGWTVENIGHLNKWTQKHHFTTGDVLKWNMTTTLGFEPSVLQVTKEAYDRCETSNPIKANVTEVTLNPPGLLYFISGIKELCDKGLKMTVKVRDARKHGALAPVGAPAFALGMPNMAAEPAQAPISSAAPSGLLVGGFMSFAVIGVAGIIGLKV